ncbi:MAG: hypothetical protein ACI9G9_001171 [Psychromonas sp.]|jgi:hypothetical protein
MSYKSSFFTFGIMLFTTMTASAISKNEEYINVWKSTAVIQMLEHGIPASITIAQGILESGAGTSKLATKGKNHFGIKCNDWSGKKMYHDDDKKRECFRVYSSAEESFIDHSLFLKKERYADLFLLQITDYRGWAKGLKKKGYATNPKYPDLLIELIEKYNLNQYDKLDPMADRRLERKINKNEEKSNETEGEATQKRNRGEEKKLKTWKSFLTEESNEIIRPQFVVSHEGDTYYRLAVKYDMGLWQLRKYNDFNPSDEFLRPGQRVYLMPKAHKSMDKINYTVKSEDEDLYNISQQEGVKLSRLVKSNPSLSIENSLTTGTVVKLR